MLCHIDLQLKTLVLRKKVWISNSRTCFLEQKTCKRHRKIFELCISVFFFFLLVLGMWFMIHDKDVWNLSALQLTSPNQGIVLITSNKRKYIITIKIIPLIVYWNYRTDLSLVVKILKQFSKYLTKAIYFSNILQTRSTRLNFKLFAY